VTIVVSLLTEPPSQEIQDFVVSLRQPEAPAEEKTTPAEEDVKAGGETQNMVEMGGTDDIQDVEL